LLTMSTRGERESAVLREYRSQGPGARRVRGQGTERPLLVEFTHTRTHTDTFMAFLRPARPQHRREAACSGAG
jgi:hypothetical protein